MSVATDLLKLNLGAGQNPVEGFLSVDLSPECNPDILCDLLSFPWESRPGFPARIGDTYRDVTFDDGSVAEIYCSHFFEHVPGRLRFAFMDELWRVLVPGGTATIVTPYWSSQRSVQDPTHEWPPICEASYFYFNKPWRRENKLDHYPVHCDFDARCEYLVTESIARRNPDFHEYALEHLVNSANDIRAVLTKVVGRE